MHDLATTFLSTANKPLITILGPTASGKTAASVALAQEIGGEIVNADSRQLYRYLDVGTAKITPEEMQNVPHHLIDVLDPTEEATAGWFQIQAKLIIDDILNRGKIPLLVGGSMLYISSLTDGLTMAPATQPAIRERLLAEYELDNGQSLYARLQELDPEAAQRVHPNNQPRLVRAVEILELTKQAHSVPRTEIRAGGKNADQDAETGYDHLIIGIERPREEIIERINQRCSQMFANGWVEEVQGLLDRGYSAADPGMKSHGYREIIDYLTTGEPDTLAALQEQIAAKTRQYARRQMTWWRGDERIEWLRH